MHPDLDAQSNIARALRELPEEQAPPYGFAEFERRAAQRARARTSVAGGPRLAAAIVIAVGGIALWVRLGGLHAPALSERAAGRGGAETGAGVGFERSAAPGTAAMEDWLASLPSEPAIMRVGTRAAVTELEDRIAEVDDLLTAARSERVQPARLHVLQQERARLVGTLVQVRYAETLADASR